MDVAVIDYGMGNLTSVVNAFSSLGIDARICASPEELNDAPRLVLPGVGAFPDGMRGLRERGWIPALESHARDRRKPLLGLCLGMQLLATVGEEHGEEKGLDWIGGRVVRFTADDPALRVPHVGWNDVHFSRQPGPFGELRSEETFYFVHSYVFDPDDDSDVVGTCDHGGMFAACLQRDNIFATQFHPEKSQKAGLTLLGSFARL
ncbi:MAG: imidazole glycerol phosphate synthase subunit HisH [Actinomycetota bacterium]|nr:imidazole glycerol phosphate synthase subunit HisH [Actinomycetota bacterium]